jgi:hypothetical protein
MLSESKIREIIDNLYNQFDKYRKNDEENWRCNEIKTQIDTLECVLGEQEIDDVFYLGDDEE